MYNLYGASYEPTSTATIPYKERRALVIASLSDLTPSGKLFKLKAMVQQCKSMKHTKIQSFLDNLQLTDICEGLLKELTNDTHLQPKP